MLFTVSHFTIFRSHTKIAQMTGTVRLADASAAFFAAHFGFALATRKSGTVANRFGPGAIEP